MASNFYDLILPDYRDLDNGSGNHRGFRVGIVENDAGIGVSMGPAESEPEDDDCYNVFLNLDEAKELRDALQEAINRAQQKTGGDALHPRRARQPTP